MKVRELLSGPEKWVQGVYAKGYVDDNLGDTILRAVEPDDPKAHCWCLVGAINKCYPIINDERIRIKTKIQAKIWPEGYCFIHTWNDESGRTFDEVKALVEELDI